MSEVENEFLDSQLLPENVTFLSEGKSFLNLSTSLVTIRHYLKEEESSSKLKACKKNSVQNKSFALDSSICNRSEIKCDLSETTTTSNKILKNWGLPEEIVNKYEQKGITEMFDWQIACLSNQKVLVHYSNLVYSAPTSAGKTLVAEILAIKTILERQKKVIIILPFVSIVREKTLYLQSIFSSCGIRVEGFMGSKSPPGGLQAVHVAICTIEKANGLVNRLIEDGGISELGAVIVDELHLLGDSNRGYLLEILLTKIKYISSKLENIKIQIVGMSATLPNLDDLAKWLEAELFITDFRPVPLEEYCLIGMMLYNKFGVLVGNIDNVYPNDDCDCVVKLCLDTINDGCSVLIFCLTRNRCESLALAIASSFYKLGCTGSEMGLNLRKQLNSEKISEVLEQLKNCPAGLDSILKSTISFGAAYHHAGLAFDERDIIEGGFKSGAIRVLVATSTLSSGVNLPARKVIIRTPVFQKQPIDILTYKQMVGRAGRMGKDTKGESIIMCTEAEGEVGLSLLKNELSPVLSCVDDVDKYMRSILEIIASQVACTEQELEIYSQCTLLYIQANKSSENLQSTLDRLKEFELIRVQDYKGQERYVATLLGKACLSSSMAPTDGLTLFYELQKARQCLVLENDLQFIYLVTPYSASCQWADLDWIHFLTLWESLTKDRKRVGEVVGVKESFIIRSVRGMSDTLCNRLNVHKRFYTALALEDLINEVPLCEVAAKFHCSRGFLQGLQQSAATFAGMVTAFCHQLGWKHLEILISQFQDRLHFGVQYELIELMKLSCLNGMRARTLYDAGFETISSIASADVNIIENAIYKSIPFQSEKGNEDDDSDEMRRRNKMKNIWITGCSGMTVREAAEKVISEARKYLEHEIGGAEIKWNDVHTRLNADVKSAAYDECGTGKEQDDINLSITPSLPSEEKHHREELVSIVKEERIQICDTNDVDLIVNLDKSVQDIKNEKSIDFCDDFSTEGNGKSQIKKEKMLNDVASSLSFSIEFRNSPFLLGDHKNSSPLPEENANRLSLIEIDKDSPSILEDLINSPSIMEDGIFEDPIILNETVFTKSRTSENIFSPNISCDDLINNAVMSEQVTNDKTSSKCMSTKDVSLFSSDFENSSMFEESLPLDLVPSKLLDRNIELQQCPTANQKTETDFFSLNSNTLLNEFKKSLALEEMATSSIDESSFDLSNNMMVLESQKLLIKDNCNGRKRSVDTSIKYCQPSWAKKAKRGNVETACAHLYTTSGFRRNKRNEILLHNKLSVSFRTLFRKCLIKCFILRGNDIFDNFCIFDNVEEAAMYIDIKRTGRNNVDTLNPITESKPIIGSNLFSVTTAKETVITNDVLISLQGITIYYNQGTCVFLDIQSIMGKVSDIEHIKELLLNWLKNTSVKLFSLKSNHADLKVCLGIDLYQSCVDISLAEWLINSEDRMSGIKRLAKKYCGIDLETETVTIDDEKKKYSNLNSNESACIKACLIWEIASRQMKILTEQNSAAENNIKCEVHVSKILAESEFYGLIIDKELASRILNVVENALEIMQKKAYKLCGREFNLSCRKDVAKVLGINKIRKLSTKKSILSALKSPIARLVIFWRKLNHILTQILYPLVKQAHLNITDNNRLKPSYNVYTLTGRICMNGLNLQNLPRPFSVPLKDMMIEREACEGMTEFNCRNIVRAAPGFVLVSADYCQLEMRILTHFCADASLTKIMTSDADVFKSIAASWEDISEDQVDDDIRQKAKQICYGIIYGMGSKALAEQLSVTEAEASVLMNSFHQTFPAIQVFTQSVICDCRKNGYVETLMKRRRYLPAINTPILSDKSSAERQAVNTTIQGSAADIAKAAMCAVDDRTHNDVPKPVLILHMHDELIYEVSEANQMSFARKLKECMENTVQLKVPLPVKLKSGYRWGSMKDIEF